MISNLERFEILIDGDGRASLRASEFFREVVRALNLITVLSGAGSPEGVITAEPGQFYMDTTGSASNILYIKKTGTGNTGWILT